MMDIKTVVVGLFMVAIQGFATAQFNRILTDPLGDHASFAGSSGNHRISLLGVNKVDNSWPTFSAMKGNITYNVLVPELKGGLGFSYAHEQASQSYWGSKYYRELSGNTFRIAYAPKITFDQEMTLSPFVSFGVCNVRTLSNGESPSLTESKMYTASAGFMKNTSK